MVRTSKHHPSLEILGSLALGQLDDSTFDEVEDHVACAQVLAETQDDSFTALLQSARSFSDTALPQTQAATLTTPMPAGKGQLTAIWQCDTPESIELPALLADHPRYRPLRLLGQGGMGAVWLAEHKVMGRHVAVKVIRPEILANPGAADRFRRETQSAARLHHPNIVTAFDADEAGDTPLLVMEYVEGVSLADEVRTRGPLSITEACGAIRQAALGLQHAHEKGLVHRDLKPQNLMRTPDGAIKILDFGLAVLLDPVAGSGGLTGVNMVVGTPDYIAPEQAEDSHLAEFKSDIYALGCTLYHLLTGRVPFPDESILRKLDGHRTQEPRPICSLRPELPEGLAAVIAKMMAKRPGDRYESAAAVAEALAPFARGATPQRPRRVARFALVALLALAVGLIGWLNGPAIYRFSTNQGLLTIETTDDDVEVRVKQGGEEVKLIDHKTGREITLKAGTYQLEITKGKDGLALSAKDFTLHRGRSEIVRVFFDPKTPDAAAVEKALREFAGSWFQVSSQSNGVEDQGEDKTNIQTFTGNRDVQTKGGKLVGISTIKIIDPTSVPRKANTLGLGVDDKVIGEAAGIFKIEGDTLHWCYDHNKGPRPTHFGTSKGSGLHYSIWRRVPPEKVGEVRSFKGHQGGIVTAAISPDGRWALSGGGHPDGGTDYSLRLWELASGKEVRRFDGHSANVHRVVFTRDGKRAISGSVDKTIRIWDVETGKELKRIDVPDLLVLSLALADDDKQVLAGTAFLHLFDLETSKELKRFADYQAEQVRACAVSRDGKLVATGDSNGEVRIWEPSSGKVLYVLKGHAGWVYDVAFSVNDSRLVSASDDKTVCVWDVNKGTLIQTFTGHTNHVWTAAFTRDGERVVSGGADQILRLWDVKTGKQLHAFAGHEGGIWAVACTPDGQHAVTASQDQSLRLWRLPEPKSAD